MASGKKNYFRHFFNARNDEKILFLMDEFGKEGYFYYFALVELCAEQSASEFREEFIFHPSRLRQELRMTTRRLNQCLTMMQSLSLLDYTMVGKCYKINLPKLSKYMGRYQSKFPSNSPNKRKEKEIKEKKIKINKKENQKIPAAIFEGWLTRYGKEFVERELRLAEMWVLDNPHKKPSSEIKFLTMWLDRGYKQQKKSNTQQKNKAEKRDEKYLEMLNGK